MIKYDFYEISNVISITQLITSFTNITSPYIVMLITNFIISC